MPKQISNLKVFIGNSSSHILAGEPEYRVILEEYMAPLIVNKEEEGEGDDDEGADDEDHHHHPTVHHATVYLHGNILTVNNTLRGSTHVIY